LVAHTLHFDGKTTAINSFAIILVKLIFYEIKLQHQIKKALYFHRKAKDANIGVFFKK
jgi:hypothetical protein